MRLRRIHVGMIAGGTAVVAAAVAFTAIVVSGDDHGRRPDYVVEPSRSSTSSLSLEWSPDGSRLYVVDDTGIDVLSGSPLAVVDRIKSERYSPLAAWSPDRSVVALSSLEPGVELWDLASGEQLPALDANGVTRAVPAWSPDGATIALAGEPGEIVTFDPRTGVELDRLRVTDQPDQVLGLAWPRADRLVAALGNTVTTIDPSTGEVVWSRAGNPQRFVVGSDAAGAVVDGEGEIYALDDGEHVGDVDVVSENILAVEWSPDGEWLIAAGDDDRPQLWATDDAATVREFPAVGPYADGVSWSPDSQRFVIRDKYDRRVVVFENTDQDDDGEELSVAEDVVVDDATWSPAGDRIAAVGRDHAVFVWEVVPDG